MAALAFGAGLAVGHVVWRPALWWVVASLGFLAAAAFFTRRGVWLAFPLTLGSLFFIGAVAIQLRNTQQLPGTEILAFADVNDTIVKAHVTHTKERFATEVTEDRGKRSMSKPNRSRRRERLTRFARDCAWGSIRKNLILSTKNKLRAPRNFRNPGAFDCQGYLADNGIVVLGSVHVAKVEVLTGFVGTRVAAWRERIHHSVVRKIHALWAADDAALMDAAVIGESAFLPPETKTDFQRSGTYHILVGVGDERKHPRVRVVLVTTYRTDLSGAVTFYLDGRSVTPELASLH